MKLQARAGTQYAALDDGTAGEGLAIFFSQRAGDANRWRIDVYAKLDTGAELLVGTFYVSPPAVSNPPGALTRQVAATVCPGAITWSVFATALGESIGSPPNTETADIILISSKCCTAPVGVSRVSERYGYHAGAATVGQTLNLLPGQTVTRINAVGTGGGGTVTINGGAAIAVPTNIGMALEPKAAIPFGAAVIAFTNVDWSVEYLESA